MVGGPQCQTLALRRVALNVIGRSRKNWSACSPTCGWVPLAELIASALLFLSAFALIVTPNVRGLRLRNGRLNATIESYGGVIGKLRSSQSPKVPLEAQEFLGLEIRKRPPSHFFY